jgi:hypothetical protein
MAAPVLAQGQGLTVWRPICLASATDAGELAVVTPRQLRWLVDTGAPAAHAALAALDRLPAPTGKRTHRVDPLVATGEGITIMHGYPPGDKVAVLSSTLRQAALWLDRSQLRWLIDTGGPEALVGIVAFQGRVLDA